MRQLQVASLADVCLLVTDGTHDTPKRVDEGFPLIKAKEIVGGAIDFDSCDQISETEHLRVIARSKPEYGDTLFAHIGASLGEAALVKTHRPFSIKNIALFKPNPDVIDGCYLYYLVISPEFQDLAKNTKTGSAQPFLSLGHLRSHRIHFHERLEDQRRIAYILSAYDDLIENNLRRIKILEEIAQNLYREWFVKFRFPGHANVRMVDSPLGETPEGWDIVKVGELLEKIKRKKKIKKQDYQLEGEIPVVDQGKDFVGGFTCDPDALHNDPLPIIVFGDHTRILKFIDFPFACGADGTQLLRSNTSRMPMSLFYSVLKSIDLSSFAYARHFKFLKEQEVLLPDEGSAEAYADFVEPLRDHIRSLMRKNNNLRQTRDLLLPKLISGELDVSTLPIDIGEAA
ncbi:restriction endonuclease subunit S [Thiolapillus sp.]|uniref:restriction endonuclease subunit S n=2 Tax=Thiolapillus sp. TaxID=2017437 RepID=UPI003AF574DA